MKSENWAWIGLLSLVAVIIAGVFGWVMNLIEIVHSSGIDGMVIVRVIGVFIAPLGAILGWL